MPENKVEMGWGAPPIKDQHPVLSEEMAAIFDRDNAEITRLKIRGLLTSAEAERARKRFVKEVAREIRAALVTK